MSREKSDAVKWVVLLFTVLFWGLAFTAIKYAVVFFTPYELAFLRFAVANLLFIPTIVLKGYRIERADVWKVFVLGVFGVSVYHVSLNAGETLISSGVASLIIATAPVFVLMFSSLLLNERITIWKAAGIALALLGVYILTNPESGGNAVGALLVFIGTLSAGIYTVGGKIMMKKYSPQTLTAYAMVLGTVPLLAFSGSSIYKIFQTDALPLLSVLFLGIFPTYISYQGWYYFLNKEEASRASVFLQTIPLVSILAGWVLLGEPVTAYTALGGGMIIGGVLMVLMHDGNN